MMTAEYVLELNNVFHSGQVEPGTCLQKLIGSVRTGVILKDVSLEVHGGELHAVLGSKGSGKRALLEVISRRAQGPTRGNISLNGVPMSMRLFQEWILDIGSLLCPPKKLDFQQFPILRIK